MVMNLTFGLFLTVIGVSRCFTTSELDQDRTGGLPHIPEHRPPVKFYHQLEKNLRCNSGRYFVREESTKRMSGEFVQHVQTENSNSHSIGGEFGIGVSIFSASVNYQYEVSHSRETETDISRSFENYFSRVTEEEYIIGEDECMILAAEMQMVVFKLQNGQRKRMIVPTGRRLLGKFTAEQLVNKDLLLDDSFELINHLSGSVMKTYNHDQIQQSMEKKNLITRMPALSERKVETTVSKPQVSYKIKNVPFMEYSLAYTNGIVDCNADDRGNLLWKFKEVPDKTGEYFIKSGKNRLIDFGYDWGANYKREDAPDQHWKIDFVDPSTVTITNVKTGAKLAQWSSFGKNCGPDFMCKSNPKIQCGDIKDRNYHWKLIPTEPQKKGRRTGGRGASGGRNGNNGRGTSGRWNGNKGRGTSGGRNGNNGHGTSGRGQGNSGGGVKWLETGKCWSQRSPKAYTSSGAKAECNPKSLWGPCCSKWGMCGKSKDHCQCAGCTDYRRQGNQHGQSGAGNWIDYPLLNHGRCGPGFRGPNGGEAGCNPSTPEYACCSQYGYCNKC